MEVVALTETPSEVETPTSSIDDLDALVAKFKKSVPATNLGKSAYLFNVSVN